MTAMQLASVLGEVREDYVNEAAVCRKPRRLGLKLGAAAACVCLAGGLIWWRTQPGTDSIYDNGGGGSGSGSSLAGGAAPAAGGAAAPGGYFEDGRSAILRSIAVYPDSADFSDVLDATLTELTEEEMRSDPLGAYFPTVLPEGYRFDFASLYHTVMRDGREYRLLRVTYAAGGEVHPVPTEDGGYAATEPSDRRSFVLFAMDYLPSDTGVFADGSRLAEPDDALFPDEGIVRFAFDGVYLCASASELSPSAMTPEARLVMLGSLPVLISP